MPVREFNPTPIFSWYIEKNSAASSPWRSYKGTGRLWNGLLLPQFLRHLLEELCSGPLEPFLAKAAQALALNVLSDGSIASAQAIQTAPITQGIG